MCEEMKAVVTKNYFEIFFGDKLEAKINYSLVKIFLGKKSKEVKSAEMNSCM